MAENSAYSVRQPTPADIDAVVAFEIQIARISFPDDPVVDPEVHAKKLRKAMERDLAGMFLAVDEGTGEAVGWLWVALNTNFLTEDRYANFRSLAVAQGAPSQVGELLFAKGIEYAREHGINELTGKVNVGNVPMRVLYRKFGFEAEHITMKKTLRDDSRAERTESEGKKEIDAK